MVGQLIDGRRLSWTAFEAHTFSVPKIDAKCSAILLGHRRLCVMPDDGTGGRENVMNESCGAFDPDLSRVLPIRACSGTASTFGVLDARDYSPFEVPDLNRQDR